MEIVVGYTDSPLGETVLNTGIAEAKLRRARLHVLHLVRVGVRNEDAGVIGHYQQRMAEIGSRLERDGVEGRSEMMMVRREPVDALLDELEEVSAELLVVGSRQRSRVGKLVLGSSVQQLVLRAHCPVLVVRQPGT